MLVATLLIRACVIALAGVSFSLATIPYIIGAFAAVLLLIGLWTPIVGALIVIVELEIAITQIHNPGLAIIVATLSATIAMIGPGAWSIDARLFGRKHVRT